ncbi:disks large-associated protein 4 isoform X3 [Eucyclogobius newberryi]|uniref:disks large-associated protein 4 isoform X3 n=1 Tax=Eucyclogobius newberryi TaxID=166745 RepID=UPI003B59F73C
MKGLGANRSRHLSDSCEPPGCTQKALCPLSPDTHGTFLLSPTLNHYGTLDPHLHQCPPTSPPNLTPDCLLQFGPMSNSNTFPRLHFTTQGDQSECSQACMGGAGTMGQGGRALTQSLSLGMGLGMGLSGAPMITSGSATISSAAAAKMNRLPANLLDQLERHLPLHRDGFSTLQFHRGRMSKQRSESPGRIRHLMHSVQKLFAKSQSLENSALKGNVNGRSISGSGSGDESGRQSRRSKSKDRATKSEMQRQRLRSTALGGLWGSDDALDMDATKAGTLAMGYRNPLTMMTLGRAVSDSQARQIPQGYNTISAHTLKTSKSSSDLKFLACQTVQMGGCKDEEGRFRGSKDDMLVKRGSWSTLTLTQARQVLQKGSATVNRTLLKTKSCHQDMTNQFLQVGGPVPSGEWAGTLGHGRGKGNEIPCRRMRSGSYVKAMGDLGDSEDSEGSPKPSPKSAARRQSYLKATQRSLSEQQPPPPPRNSLPCLKELSTNRSLDNLDCLVSPVGTQPRHRSEFSYCSATLGRGSQVCAQSCGYSVPYGEVESQAVEALDLPAPTCFRSRSHSYLRAIQAGCSQDDDTSVDSDSPPPTAANYCYSSSTLNNRKAPPPVPPRTTSKPLISVTLQSSTESAQDTYYDQQDRGSEVNSQSGRSNSSDSLCSIRTGSLARGAYPTGIVTPAAPVPIPIATTIVPPVPAPRDLPPNTTAPTTASTATATTATATTSTSTQCQHDTLTPIITLDEPPTAPKRKLSSIGIQVDCILPVTRQEPPPLTAPLKFQSIGVQVENGRPLSRDNSMASRQNTETEPLEPQETNCVNTGKPNCTTTTTTTNGQDKTSEQPLQKTRISSPPESLDPALDPSSLPPPDPSLQSDNGSTTTNSDGPQASTPTCARDGNWFLKLLQAETGRMEGWCQQMEQETKDNQLSEEVLGTIRSAVGSAQLLIAQKFEQFRGLCNENLKVDANPRPTAQDLAGFWDLLQLTIEDISLKFDELYQLKANNWKLPEKTEKKDETKLPSSVPKKPCKPKLAAGKDRSMDSAVDKQRQEARKRLMAAKRAASVRQNSATESADSIEIYVPEAQTRL